MKLFRTCPVFAVAPLAAQTLPSYDVSRTTAPITVDAKLDEPAWRKAPPVDDFHFNWYKDGAQLPVPTGRAKVRCS